MTSNNNLGDVFTGGATTSQHVDAEDDDHFKNTTFQLKRTRSLGLLDEFILPEEKSKAGAPGAADSGSFGGSGGSGGSGSSGSFGSSGGSGALSEKLALDLEMMETETSRAKDGKLHNFHESRGAQEEDIGAEDTHESLGSPALQVSSPEMLPHDDTDVHNEPSRHVDYLSHQWSISDISKSWRYVIQKRKDVSNSARLENASWRTWAQRRSNLKTISPEVVNWSKDNDVTWLYGPILKETGESEEEDEDHRRITTATSAVAGDISIAQKQKKGPKPILKRRTMQDIMISHSNLLKLQLATNKMHDKQRQQYETQQNAAQSNENIRDNEPPEFDDYDAISAKLNSQYNITKPSSNSETNIPSLQRQALAHNDSTGRDASSFPKSGLLSNLESYLSTSKTLDTTKDNRAIEDSDLNSPSPLEAKEHRHIHFNDEVQQCIAIDEYSDDDDYYEDNDEDFYYDEDESYLYENPNDDYESQGDSDEEDDDEDEEGGFFLNVKSLSSASLSAPSISHTRSMSSISDKGDGSGNNDPHREADSTSKGSTEDTASVSTSSSKVYKTIHILPPTTLNHGSSDEESDEENPYTSSQSHNVNNTRGYDYYYDYNTVYTVDPNHAIYGSVGKNIHEVPDVVDVPENITIGSNFDYELIENKDINDKRERNLANLKQPQVENFGGDSKHESTTNENQANAGQSESSTSNLTSERQGKDTFSLNSPDSDSSDDSEDECLSISTKNSSQSLAQLVFANNMTLTSDNNSSHFPEGFDTPRVLQNHISSINPNSSTTSVSRQPTSSNSLSQLFFTDGMTPQTQKETESLAKSFFSTPSDDNNSISQIPRPELVSSQESSLSQKSFTSTQKKVNPLPPHTTSTNAFREHSTSPQTVNTSKGAFLFDSDASSSEESDPNVSGYRNESSSSYVSLSKVADKTGIKSPSPEDQGSIGNSSQSSSVNSSNLPQNTNIMGHAKGLANHFLNNWKSNE